MPAGRPVRRPGPSRCSAAIRTDATNRDLGAMPARKFRIVALSVPARGKNWFPVDSRESTVSPAAGEAITRSRRERQRRRDSKFGRCPTSHLQVRRQDPGAASTSFRTAALATRQGPLRPNPEAAQKDRPLVSRSEGRGGRVVKCGADGNRKVAARRCPGTCRRKSSASDPHDPEPRVQRATTVLDRPQHAKS